MPEVTVRRARHADQQALGALWLRLLEQQATLDDRFAPSDDALERWHNDFSAWLHDDQRRLFVAERAGDLVGFASAQRYYPPPIYAHASEVHLDELYVESAWQGQGIGTRLVEAVEAWADELGAHRLRIGVLAANAEGLAFWTSRGAIPFATTLTIERTTPEDAAPRERAVRLGFG